jgi:hypothetical protein
VFSKCDEGYLWVSDMTIRFFFKIYSNNTVTHTHIDSRLQYSWFICLFWALMSLCLWSSIWYCTRVLVGVWNSHTLLSLVSPCCHGCVMSSLIRGSCVTVTNKEKEKETMSYDFPFRYNIYAWRNVVCMCVWGVWGRETSSFINVFQWWSQTFPIFPRVCFSG